MRQTIHNGGSSVPIPNSNENSHFSNDQQTMQIPDAERGMYRII